jgi:hypothetical protein
VLYEGGHDYGSNRGFSSIYCHELPRATQRSLQLKGFYRIAGRSGLLIAAVPSSSPRGPQRFKVAQPLMCGSSCKTTFSEMALHVLAYNLTRVMNIMGIRPLMAAIRA